MKFKIFFLAGYLMDKYDHLRYIFLFLFTCAVGLLYVTYPHLQHLYAFFTVVFFQGVSTGLLGTGSDTNILSCITFSNSTSSGGNAQCLHIWRNRQSGPYVHSIHSSFALGALVAQVLAAPFLSTRSSTVKRLEAAGKNETEIEEYLESSEASDDSRVAIFFALSGGITVIISLGFLYFGLKAVANHKEHLKREETDADNKVTHNNEEEKRTREAEKHFWSSSIIALISLQCIFFFFYVGLEASVGIYLTTFSVKSKLQLSRAQGAHVTAVFLGSFAAMRFIAIFVATKAKPSIVMWSSFVLCLGGSIAAVFFAEHSPEVLQVWKYITQAQLQYMLHYFTHNDVK